MLNNRSISICEILVLFENEPILHFRAASMFACLYTRLTTGITRMGNTQQYNREVQPIHRGWCSAQILQKSSPQVSVVLQLNRGYQDTLF